MIYDIAGIRVKMTPRYEKLINQSKEYLSNGEADIDIDFPDSITEEFFKEYPYLSKEDCEYILYATGFYEKILDYDAFMLHSSAVVKDNEAYLFSAPSGTGKSTHTQLWLKNFRDAYILNDDKPAIRITPKGIYAYGTPFSGKTNLNVNIGVPLKAICILERGEENKIEQVSVDFAIYSILNQTLRPKDEKRMDILLNLLDKVLRNVGVYRFICNTDPKSAIISYEGMKDKNICFDVKKG